MAANVSEKLRKISTSPVITAGAILTKVLFRIYLTIDKYVSTK